MAEQVSFSSLAKRAEIASGYDALLNIESPPVAAVLLHEL